MSAQSNKVEATITPADNALRKKIGAEVELAQIFTPEKIEACQHMMEDALAAFLREMEGQLVSIDDEYNKAAANPIELEPAMKRMAELAFLMKKSMETLNFVFGYQVTKSLYDYLHETTAAGPNTLLVICKHIAVLNIILKDGIKGDGGAMGKEMLANLQALVKKAQG